MAAPLDAAALTLVPDAAVPGHRGEACSREHLCAESFECQPMPGGYCASRCGEGQVCDAACVETWRAGELCLATCTRDADCRADEGYVCDPRWKACVIPNATTIVPRSCPAPRGIARDPAFAPSTRLSAVEARAYAAELAAALDGKGELVAVFAARSAQRAGDALASIRVDAAARATSTSIASPHARHAAPSLARDAAGTLHAVWIGSAAEGPPTLAYATSRDGVTWSAPRALDDDGACAGGAACPDKPLIVAGAGALYVLDAAHGLRVRASRDGGKTFAPPRTALAGDHGNATVGADGRLHVVAIDGSPLGGFGSANQRIQYTVSADGGRTFARPITVSRTDEMLPYFASNPSIAVDTRRRWIYVAYVRGGRDAVWDVVIAASKDGGETWTRRRITDDPPCAIHMIPNLALDPRTGKLHVAWYDSRGERGRFAHAVCTIGAATCTQVGRINDAPFATLSTARQGPRALGDRAALVLDDKRRMLHAVWAQPIDDGGHVATQIFHAKAKLPAR